MKKIVFFLFLCFCTLETIAQSPTDNGWDKWQKTSCYSKIWYRLKYDGLNGEQHHWKIQFKSDYQGTISFNYHVTDKIGEYTVTTHRKTSIQGKPSEEIDIFTKLEDIYILVDKVSLSPYPKNFIECE